jgi:predicted nucleic acid-binding protein
VRYLLDTNVLSELRKGARAHPLVREWFEKVEDESIFTSVLVLGELRRGVESIRRRDPVAAVALDQWLARLVTQFAKRIVVVDVATANRWGMLNVPDPVPTVDGLLAATALQHEMTLVTRNTRDVERTGVATLNPFGD